MYRYIFIGLLSFVLTSVQAQSKKSTPKKKPEVAVKDTVVVEEVVEEEMPNPTEFIVYTKRAKKKKTKLCINLVGTDSIFNYCINDSILHDPEVYKLLFEAKDQDSTYSLVYVAAFSKYPPKPQCDAGKEVKLFFVRWSTTTNKAIVRSKNIESCMKAITNMTQEPIDAWDRQQPLIISYHKGGSNFSEVKFDPQNYRLGLQTTNDAEAK